jgi:AraC-like DNA-binding protein
MKRLFGFIVVVLMLVPMGVLADTNVDALYDQADSLYNLQRYDEAKKLALEALKQCKESTDMADCASLLALIHIRKGDFGEAVKYAKQCNAIDMKSGDPDAISSSLNTLAGIYMSMRQPQEAEKYILKAISYAKQADNPQRLAVLHGMASEVYYHLQQNGLALDFATKAYDMERQLGRQDKMAIRQAERAAALIALQRNAEAQHALAEAIPGLREHGNIHSLGIACNQMGNLMHQEHNDSAAVRYYNEALQIFLQQHDLYNESFSRKGLYEALRHTNPELAMEHNDRYLALRDSIYDKDTGELLSKYAAEYGNLELQEENSNLLQSRRLYIIIGVILLLALLAYGWWRTRHDRRRMQELILQISNLKESGAQGVQEVKEEPVEEPVQEEIQPSAQQNEDADSEDRLFLMKLVNVVNEGLPTGQYGVEAVASEMNMGVQTFRRRLMAVTGESPKSFISAIQMERASKLLVDNPDMPVSRVANLCGYDETNSFARSFKRAYGITPSQYRENNEKQAD